MGYDIYKRNEEYNIWPMFYMGIVHECGVIWLNTKPEVDCFAIMADPSMFYSSYNHSSLPTNTIYLLMNMMLFFNQFIVQCYEMALKLVGSS